MLLVRRFCPLSVFFFFFFFFFKVLIVVAMVEYQTSPANESSSRPVLSRSKDKDEPGFQILNDPQDDVTFASYTIANDDDEELSAGGFSSLDGMLHWAIGISDPAKLKEQANDAKRLSSTELKERQMEIMELMDKQNSPSDKGLMKIAIADLNNSSISVEDRQRALNELLILVEPIENANDLDKLGGLTSVVRELNNSDPDIRKTSAWILGKACQNNALVQKQTLALRTLPKLIKMVKSNNTEEAIKALYAISSLIRNNNDGQEIFYAEAGELMLQGIICSFEVDIRLKKKAIYLLADLAYSQLEYRERTKIPLFSNHVLLQSLIDVTSSSDFDLQEQALLALKNLLQLGHIDAVVFKDVFNFDNALERMREQLVKKRREEEEEENDFVLDMEILLDEVDMIFRKRLQK